MTYKNIQIQTDKVEIPQLDLYNDLLEPIKNNLKSIPLKSINGGPFYELYCKDALEQTEWSETE